MKKVFENGLRVTFEKYSCRQSGPWTVPPFKRLSGCADQRSLCVFLSVPFRPERLRAWRGLRVSRRGLESVSQTDAVTIVAEFSRYRMCHRDGSAGNIREESHKGFKRRRTVGEGANARYGPRVAHAMQRNNPGTADQIRAGATARSRRLPSVHSGGAFRAGRPTDHTGSRQSPPFTARQQAFPIQ